MSADYSIRVAVVEAIRCGENEVSFVAKARAVYREEMAARTAATARALYSSKDSGEEA